MNFGVLLNSVGASQLSYLVIQNLNELGNYRPDIDAIVYYENMHKNCMPPNFAVMQMAEAWGQHGTMIATSLSTAQKLIGFPSERKLFFIWDLEWLRGHRQRYYSLFADIYTHPDLELVARSKDHKNAIENAFNKEVKHIVSDFDITELLKALD